MWTLYFNSIEIIYLSILIPFLNHYHYYIINYIRQILVLFYIIWYYFILLNKDLNHIILFKILLKKVLFHLIQFFLICITLCFTLAVKMNFSRAKGDLVTPATWMRSFVMSHKDYKQVSNYIISYRRPVYQIILHHIVSYQNIPYRRLVYQIILHHIVSYHNISYRRRIYQIILHHIVSYHNISYHRLFYNFID